MTPLFKKLNYKDQNPVLVLNPPPSFVDEQVAMSAIIEWPTNPCAFVLAFATVQTEVDAYAADFAHRTDGDAVIWIAYPKGSSKRYTCDFNRDTGWEVLGKLGFEPVRQVAIDEDWSALRFRRVDFIKTMTRSFAMTEAGKERINTTTKQAPVAPPDFAAALDQSALAKAFYEQLAPSHKKEYIRWIEDAKREETRLGRIAKAVTMLTEGKRQS